jgi:hypothetical protein
MNEDGRSPTGAQPPDDTAAVHTATPSAAAGGFDALAATLRYAGAQTGLLRGARVLARTNQTSGFDCPGCAWP